MSEPFIGQISTFGFNFAPINWSTCQGQILPIQQYSALFSLIGNTFGGNGTSNFALPNLQGTVTVSQGTSVTGTQYKMGQTGGAYTVALNATSAPPHNHSVLASSNSSTSNTAQGNVLARPEGTGDPRRPEGDIYNQTAPNTRLTVGVASAGGIPPTGNPAPHNNIQPYLVVNYCICLIGIMPTRP